MKKLSSIVLFFCVVFTLLCNQIMAQKIKIGFGKTGQSEWFGESWFESVQGIGQFWETTSNQPANYLQLLRGEITLIQRNNEQARADGDWNIFVKPDYEFQFLLKNSNGDINRNNDPKKDKTIELEILTPFPLGDFFSEGDYIETFGWWVEDYGHRTNKLPAGDIIESGMGGLIDIVGGLVTGNDNSSDFIFGKGKTEIHPFIYLKKRDRKTGKDLYFSAFDVSGRFNKTHRNEGIVSEDLFDIRIWFPPEISYNTLNSSYDSPIFSNSITEKSSIDRMLDPGLINEKTEVLTTEFEDFLIVAPKFKDNLTPNDDRGEKMEFKTRPIYFAEFSDPKRENNIEESIETSIRKINNKDVLTFTVNLSIEDLENSNGNNESYSKFSFDQVNIYGEIENSIIELNSTHDLVYNIQYAPSIGLNQTEYQMDFFGFNKQKNIFPPFANPSMVRSENNKYFRTKRVYKIRPSKMNMEVKELDGEYISFCGTRGRVSCTNSYKLLPEVFLADENLAVGKYKWKFRFLNRFDGTLNANPVYSIVPSPSFSNQGSPSIPRVVNYTWHQVRNHGNYLEVEFLNKNGEVYANSDELQMDYNNSAIEILCEVTTSIGEKISYSQILKMPSCDCDWRDDLRVIPDMIPRLIPALLLADHLGLDVQNLIESNGRLPQEFLKNYPTEIRTSMIQIDALESYNYKSRKNKIYMDALFEKSKKDMASDMHLFYTQIKKLPTRVIFEEYPTPTYDEIKLNENLSSRIIMTLGDEKNMNKDLIEIENFLLNNPKNRITIIGESNSNQGLKEVKRQSKLIRKKLKDRGYSTSRISVEVRENKWMEKSERIIIRNN